MVLAYKDPEAENEYYEDTKSVSGDTLNDEESPDEKEEKRKHEREIFEKLGVFKKNTKEQNVCRCFGELVPLQDKAESER